MEIRVLRYFLTVAREGSITKAADVLHVSQPTLSKQLMDLENELGKKLFLRGSRNITLTEAGMYLHKKASEIVELTDQTAADFQNMEEIVYGDIHIGSGETDAIRLVARVLKEIQKEHPQIRYHFFSGNAEDVKERLDSGLLDFGVLIEPTDIAKYDYIRLPTFDTWGILMPKDAPLAAKEYIEPGDLWGLPLITSRQKLIENEMSGWLGRNFKELNIVATYNLLYNASVMVEEGLGYALCLDRLINTTGNSSLCFRPLIPALKSSLDLVWKKYQSFSKSEQLFLERLQSRIYI
ncbi:MAG TPA: LysR family transcriptional regulator [Candidatus Eubacterium avistercoris]|uniref:LysR family transcriptional regulator n=1 Tax=Candidatus Eubacterium avistercoris TaxID=2838567 RepID=A0A9D2IHH9_9FIRM|nr:LysR family transcriptional regulator [Candidatus Eubacterium avistercoris]